MKKKVSRDKPASPFKTWSHKLFVLVITYVFSLAVAYYSFILGTLIPPLFAFGGGEPFPFMEVVFEVILGMAVASPLLAFGGAVFFLYKPLLRYLHIIPRILIIIFFISSSALPFFIRSYQLKEYVRTIKEDNERHEGLNIRYYDNAKQHILFKENFVNGVQHGKQEYFYENGQLKSEEYFINGKVDGIAKDYFENGDIRCETYFKLGVVIGREYCNYENGKLRYEIFYDELGNYIESRSYNESGKLTSYNRKDVSPNFTPPPQPSVITPVIKH